MKIIHEVIICQEVPDGFSSDYKQLICNEKCEDAFKSLGLDVTWFASVPKDRYFIEHDCGLNTPGGATVEEVTPEFAIRELAAFMSRTGMSLADIKHRAENPIDTDEEYRLDQYASWMYTNANALGLYDLT